MSDKVECKICGKQFKQITHKHTKVHGLTTKQYCWKYNLSPSQLLSDSTRQKSKVTLQNMIKSYGQKKGKKRWDSYCFKQANKNTFQYKKEKYGWTRQQFDQYNKSRAVTLDNCIRRHGIQKGTKVFNDYCQKQAYAGNKLQYFIQKYGEKDGLKIYQQICKNKAITLGNMIKIYGQQLGKQVYSKWLDKKIGFGNGFSKISQQLFNSISQKMKRNDFKYGANGGQKCILMGNSYCFTDFYDPQTEKIIEFYGSFWHADPNEYNADDIMKFPNTKQNLMAKQIWQKDRKRIQKLNELGYNNIKIVWQLDYKKDPQKVINQCIEFLKGKN